MAFFCLFSFNLLQINNKNLHPNKHKHLLVHHSFNIYERNCRPQSHISEIPISHYHSDFHNEIQNHILTAKKKKKKSHPAGQGAVIVCEAEMVDLTRSLIKCTTSS